MIEANQHDAMELPQLEPYQNASITIRIYGREGLGDIAGKDFERKVVGTLETIRCSQVGRLLLQSLKYSLNILPHRDGLDSRRADETPQSWDAAGQNGTIMYQLGKPIVINGTVRRYATGGGTGCDIHFSPDGFETSATAAKRGSILFAGQRRDEVLFHEMSHALMDMYGCENRSIPPAGFLTKNEFWAIMTTNIYASAWNRPLLKDHESGATISNNDADAFYLQYASMIDWMCRDIPIFTRSVAQLEWIPFNPFRDSYNRQKAKLVGV